MTRTPVTIRLDPAEYEALRAEAADQGVTFTQLARDRLGLSTPWNGQATDHENRLNGLDERVRALEQFANRDY